MRKLYYCEDEKGHVYITDECAPAPSGFIKHMTTIPSVMDRIYAKLNSQEREQHQELIEKMYNENAPRMALLRSRLLQRKQESSCEAFERSVIVSVLAQMDERERKMQENHVYGVAAIQSTEANPKEPGANRVIFDGMVN